jgi:hypothetical protein
MATFPIRAWAENNWRDQTPDAARGKPINQMATNLALLRAAEKGWIDEIKMPWPKPQLSRPATASAECRDLLDTPGHRRTGEQAPVPTGIHSPNNTIIRA